MCPWIQWEHAGKVPRDVTTTQQQRNNKIQQTQAESLDSVVFFLPEMCPWIQWEHAGKVPRDVATKILQFDFLRLDFLQVDFLQLDFLQLDFLRFDFLQLDFLRVDFLRFGFLQFDFLQLEDFLDVLGFRWAFTGLQWAFNGLSWAFTVFRVFPEFRLSAVRFSTFFVEFFCGSCVNSAKLLGRAVKLRHNSVRHGVFHEKMLQR